MADKPKEEPKFKVERLDPNLKVDTKKALDKLFEIAKRSMSTDHMNAMSQARFDTPLLNVLVAGVLASREFVDAKIDLDSMMKATGMTQEEAEELQRTIEQSIVTDMLITYLGMAIKDANGQFEKDFAHDKK